MPGRLKVWNPDSNSWEYTSGGEAGPTGYTGYTGADSTVMGPTGYTGPAVQALGTGDGPTFNHLHVTSVVNTGRLIGTASNVGNQDATLFVTNWNDGTSGMPNSGVLGGFIGVSSEGADDKVGLVVFSDGSVGNKYGIQSIATSMGNNYAIYGVASGGTNNWAGYFTGTVAVNGGLHVGGTSDPGDNNLVVDGAANARDLHLSGNRTAPNFGIGLEMGYNGTYSDILSYDRSGGAVYKGLNLNDNIYIAGGATTCVSISGGLHVGGTSDPGDNNLVVDGNVGIGTTAPGTRFQSGPNYAALSGLTVLGSVVTPEANINVSNTSTTDLTAAGLLLHNNGQTAGSFAPFLGFSRKSNSGTYNALMAAISAVAITGQGIDSNWIDGQLHFYTGRTDQAGVSLSMVIDNQQRVGIGTAPTYTLDVNGNVRCSTGFGCNSKTPQTAYATGAWDAPGAGAFGADSAAHFAALVLLVQKLQAALVANGICS